MKKVFLIAFAALCLSIPLCTESASALEISETVTQDNVTVETILYTADSADLERRLAFFSTFNDVDYTLPHPALVASKLSVVKDNVSAYGFPEGVSMLFIDFGPNWESIVNADSNAYIKGRYGYVFYGVYDTEDERVESGGSYELYGKYALEATNFSPENDPDTYELSIHGPYYFVSYNPDSNVTYVARETYSNLELTGYSSVLNFTGIVIGTDEDHPTYYPRVTTFANGWETYLEFGSYYLFADDSFENLEWDSAWTGYISVDDNSNLSFWDYFIGGDIEWEDVELPEGKESFYDTVQKAVKSMTNVVDFISSVPSHVETMVSVLPDPFADFIIIAFGLLISAVLFKVALSIIRG